MDIQTMLQKIQDHLECMMQIGSNTFMGLSPKGHLHMITIIEDEGKIVVNDLGPVVRIANRMNDVFIHFIEEHTDAEVEDKEEDQTEVTEAGLAAMTTVGGVH